jgi:hypothetical protein
MSWARRILNSQVIPVEELYQIRNELKKLNQPQKQKNKVNT